MGIHAGGSITRMESGTPPYVIGPCLPGFVQESAFSQAAGRAVTVQVAEVIKDSVTGPTDPYDVHDILLGSTEQPLDPGYSFVFPKAGTATA